jgi:hypothetical protein
MIVPSSFLHRLMLELSLALACALCICCPFFKNRDLKLELICFVHAYEYKNAIKYLCIEDTQNQIEQYIYLYINFIIRK